MQHELKHGYDAAYGRQERGDMEQGSIRINKRERQAVGLPPYENEPYTENKYRSDRNQPPRSRY